MKNYFLFLLFILACHAVSAQNLIGDMAAGACHCADSLQKDRWSNTHPDWMMESCLKQQYKIHSTEIREKYRHEPYYADWRVEDWEDELMHQIANTCPAFAARVCRQQDQTLAHRSGDMSAHFDFTFLTEKFMYGTLLKAGYNDDGYTLTVRDRKGKEVHLLSLRRRSELTKDAVDIIGRVYILGYTDLWVQRAVAKDSALTSILKTLVPLQPGSTMTMLSNPGEYVHINLPGIYSQLPGGDGPEDSIIIQEIAQGETHTAVFPGGRDSLIHFISAHISYPAKDKADKKEGDVVVSFSVNDAGAIGDISLLHAGTEGMNGEVLNVVRKFPHFRLERPLPRGEKFYFTLPVRFEVDQPVFMIQEK